MLRTGALVVALSLLSVVSVLAIASAVGDDGDARTGGQEIVLAPSTAPTVSAPPVTDTSVETAAPTSPATTVAPTTAVATTVAATAPPTENSTTVASTSEPDAEAASAETQPEEPAPETTDVESGDAAPATTGAEPPTNTTEEPAPDSENSDGAPGYPVLPDGSPVPVEAVYEGSVVTLTGLVPSEDARMQLEALAIAGAPRPDTTAVNLLEINENVPLSVGARVLSLDSVRFPDGSADITPEHAAEVDGVVRTLEALPHVTLLVIGHSDRRGNDQSNLLLSQDRADAMVLYLASQGIDPSRMSSRAVGESNPISEANSEAALQLNRRTELIFYGLLAG